MRESGGIRYHYYIRPAKPAVRTFAMRCRAPAVVTLALLVPGCGSSSSVLGITPYRIEIQQGNYVSQDSVAQLKPGMTKEQVKFLLGTPLVNDIFHADRWDYAYYREPSRGVREEGRLVVYFDDGRLTRVEGAGMPRKGSSEGTAQ